MIGFWEERGVITWIEPPASWSLSHLGSDWPKPALNLQLTAFKRLLVFQGTRVQWLNHQCQRSTPSIRSSYSLFQPTNLTTTSLSTQRMTLKVILHSFESAATFTQDPSKMRGAQDVVSAKSRLIQYWIPKFGSLVRVLYALLDAWCTRQERWIEKAPENLI